MKTQLFAFLVIAVLLVGGCSENKKPDEVIPTSQVVSTGPNVNTLALEIDPVEITPSSLYVKSGDRVELLILNNKNSTHLVIDGFVDEEIGRKAEMHVSFSASKKGSFTIYVDNVEKGQLVVE